MRSTSHNQTPLNLIIVGAGGFARELHPWLPEVYPTDKYRFKGFLGRDDTPGPREQILADPFVYIPQSNDRFVMAIGDLAARRDVINSLLAKDAQFVSFIHPTSLISASANIGSGAVIYPYTIISNTARLGDFVHLSLYASVGHDAQTGDNCYLCPYATLNGESRIGNNVFLGSHATVGPGIVVGNNCKISANSAALRNIPEGSLVHGVPGVCSSLVSTVSPS